MKRLEGKTTFITGASSGIGKACAFYFAEEGSNLIISSRTAAKIEQVAEDIRIKFGVSVYSMSMDVRSNSDVTSKIKNLPKEWQSVDILINNAGLARGFNKLHEDDPDGWDEMIDTNVKGLLYVSRQIVPQMVEKKSGHIINIGSIAGHEAYPGGGVYCATKHAVDAITKTFKMELIDKNIRVSTVDPGMVETNFSNIRFAGDVNRAKKVYEGIEPLYADDIADAVLFCATRKENTNIGQIVMTPIAQASAFVNYRDPDKM
ncbi:MAG: SDR family NAD(P)-dependent oxidoreductase [Melioribacteraceae bacterium]|nr:SDR family NAD(P)-dependent oxidoreductase [Melioribacteraceae bacterium]